MSAITSANLSKLVAAKATVAKESTSAKAVPCPAPSLKAASLTLKSNKVAVSESSSMMVWTPIDNKFFETLSFLPPLTPDEISKQVDYIVREGAIPCVEFSEPENAITDGNRKSGIVSSCASGYYDNRYWTMWKLPMFGCTDGTQVLKEIDQCVKCFPTCYVRICGFNNIKQVQTSSFIVHRPKGCAAKPVDQRSVM